MAMSWNGVSFSFHVRSGTISKYTYALATMADVDAINAIMERTNKEIASDDVFVMDDKDFITHHIERQGFIVTVTHHDEIIAFLLVRFPKQDDDNLGRDAQVDDDELHHVAHIESLAVVPKHRGNRLQYKMIHYAEKIIKQRGLKYSMATVSPKNKYSLINFLKHDFRIVKIKRKYSGVRRLILKKQHKDRKEGSQ